jgi:predicted nucleic acid-binding protein
VHVDTSVLIDALTFRKNVALLEAAFDRGHNLSISTPVLFEWLRGSRTEDELAVTAALFPDDAIAVFDPNTARLAASLYSKLRRARSREADISIAACAIEHGAALWTLNEADFADIPGLRLYQ